MSASVRSRLVALLTSILVAVGIVLVPSAAHAAPPVPHPGFAVIYGNLSLPSGVSGGAAVELYAAGQTSAQTVTSMGDFEIQYVLPGSYRIEFVYGGPDYFPRTGWAPPGGQPGDNFTIAAGDALEVNGTPQRGGSITGSVSVPSGSSAQGINVIAFDSVGRTVGNAITGAGGAYSMTDVPVGRIRLSFVPTAPGLFPEYWSDKSSLLTADPVIVTSQQTTAGISPTLSGLPLVEGTVTKQLPGGGTAPAAGVTVRLTRLSDLGTIQTVTDSQGKYSIDTTGQGEFVLLYWPGADPLAYVYWGDAASLDGAEVLVADGSYRGGLDITLPLEATITGRVQYDLGTVANLDDANVQVYEALEGGEVGYVTGGISLSNGTFEIGHLPPSQYYVYVFDVTGKGLASEYWQDSRSLAGATILDIEAGESVDLGDIVLESNAVSTQRLSGPDRFATGVAVTKKQFPGANPTVPVVYIANGLNYPDALTAGPAAIKKGGALLLVTPDSIPASVAAELDRLSPDKIIVVGGSASVSNAVKSALEAYVDSPSDVKRLGGADRFSTSALVVRDAFAGGAETAFFATGLNFPDALAAGPAAGHEDAPIILVNGAAAAPDALTLDLIDDLGVQSAYFVGLSASLSDGVANGIVATLPNPGERLGGADRYATAVHVNQTIFGSAEETLLATGTGFADALSGGPLAGALGIPMYLSTPSCVPGTVLAGMNEVGIAKAFLLGGTSSLSANVANMVSCG